MTDAAPVLTTARLVLRPPARADLDGWAAFCADQAAMRFLGGTVSRAEAWRSLAYTAGCWSLQGYGLFSVLLRDSGAWIGRVGPNNPEGWPAPEIGYGLLSAFQGRGLAREAATAAIGFAFERLGWNQISHMIDPDNAASIALARALGSNLVGPVVLPPPYSGKRIDRWTQTRATWTARASA